MFSIRKQEVTVLEYHQKLVAIYKGNLSTEDENKLLKGVCPLEINKSNLVLFIMIDQNELEPGLGEN